MQIMIEVEGEVPSPAVEKITDYSYSSGVHDVWADLQRVPQESVGAAVRCMFLRQVASVGCRSWLECLEQVPVAGYDFEKLPFHIAV